MKTFLIPACAVLALAASAALAQTAPNPGHDASQAQLQREHNRAVKAGDTANDPMNPASSDALNQQQLQGAPIANTSADSVSSDSGPDSGPDSGGPATPPPADATAAPPPATSTPPPTLPDTDSATGSSSSDSASSSM